MIMSEWRQDDYDGSWRMRIGEIVAVAWDRGEWSVYAAGNHEPAGLASGWAADDTLTGAMRGAADALRAIGRSLIDAAGHEGAEWGEAEELVDDGSELVIDPIEEATAALVWAAMHEKH